MNTAKAHCRTDRKFSSFHKSLLSENPNRDFALKHLYSIENTKEILAGLGWSQEEIKDAEEHISIDVWYYVVRVHVPKMDSNKRDGAVPTSKEASAVLLAKQISSTCWWTEI